MGWFTRKYHPPFKYNQNNPAMIQSMGTKIDSPPNVMGWFTRKYPRELYPNIKQNETEKEAQEYQPYAIHEL